jgi:hypothetical protein
MTERIALLKASDIGSRQVLRIGLWYVEDDLVPGFEAWNAGFEQARDLMTLASDRHPETVNVYDAVTQDQGRELYEQSVKPSASPGQSSWWGYRISGVFGSKQYPGCWTGREVPLLLVHFDGVTLPYAAPNEGKRARGGSRERSVRTILNVLQMLGPAEQQRLFGTKLGSAGEGE